MLNRRFSRDLVITYPVLAARQSEEERILRMRLSASIVRLSVQFAVLKGHSLYGIP